MFRKTILALAATATLGIALAPTLASARDSDDDRYDRNRSWSYRSHSPAFGFRFYSPRAYAYAPRCYITRQWVHTHWGWRRENVRVCRY